MNYKFYFITLSFYIFFLVLISFLIKFFLIKSLIDLSYINFEIFEELNLF